MVVYTVMVLCYGVVIPELNYVNVEQRQKIDR